MMAFLNKTQSLLKRYKRDEGGTMALTWALSLTVMLGAMGAAVDFAMLSNADSQSQSIADTTALAAAIYVKNHGMPPANSADGYVDGVPYTAEALGYEYKGWVKNGDLGVTIQVDYDDNAKEATVTVSGDTTPMLMQVMGYESLAFKAQSIVSYLDVDEKFPASITLVLDNSGSMSWDDKLAEDSYPHNGHWHGDSPNDAISRISGLKKTVNTFNSELQSRLGTETDGGQRTIRMGMIPYNSSIISSGEHPMSWGYIPTNKVNTMVPNGATNSNPPMVQAKTWLDGEEAFHEAEAEAHNESYKEPLKFVIFMTDGQNTAGNYEVLPGDTGYWYGTINGSWYYATWAYPNFVEGTLQLDTDRVTIARCQEMKDDGVHIFAIGYSLEVGAYNENNYSGNGNSRAEYVSQGLSSTAYTLLQSCASKPENFIKAENAEDLEAAFDEIQNAIVEELIRIKS